MKKHELTARELMAQELVMRLVRCRTNAFRLQWTHMVITAGERHASGHEPIMIQAGVRLTSDRSQERKPFPLVGFESCNGYLDVRARVDLMAAGEGWAPYALKVNCRGGHAVGWGANGAIDGAYALFEFNIPRKDV